MTHGPTACGNPQSCSRTIGNGGVYGAHRRFLGCNPILHGNTFFISKEDEKSENVI